MNALPKSQIPKPKAQIPKSPQLGIWDLGFGIWDLKVVSREGAQDLFRGAAAGFDRAIDGAGAAAGAGGFAGEKERALERTRQCIGRVRPADALVAVSAPREGIELPVVH